MRILLFVFVCCLNFQQAFSQHKPAYILYNKEGKKVSYSKMLKAFAKADVLLFGEFHNNPIAHWLELEVTMDMKQRRELVLGAEMFEADNQEALSLYVDGKLSAKGLDSSARLWKNYPTDYAPLVDFAKAHSINFIATNIPRKFASLVAKRGFEVLDSLPTNEKNWIAPLPIAYDAQLPGYTKMMEMMKDHGGPNLPKAQAIKDATMAHFILKNYKAGSLFIHFNGSFHSQNHDGIVWYLRNQRPELNYATITVVSQKNIGKLLEENKNLADYIICVDEDMTTTY
ncbi:MAG: ChaN family lipoprotein [Chitinophagaceae bacterium]